MIHPTPGTPPRTVPISARRARRIRATCTLVGAGLMVAGAVLGLVIAILGAGLPTSYNPVNVLMFGTGCVAALMVFFAGLALAGSRPYVSGEHLNLGGARTARRALLVLWGGAAVSSVVAAALLLLLVAFPTSSSRVPAELGFTATIWAYLLLLVTPCVLAGAAFFAARRLLRPSP